MIQNRTVDFAGLRVVSIGNHEFDFKIDILKQRMAQSTFPYLAANIENIANLIVGGMTTTGGYNLSDGTPIYADSI